MANMSYCRFRNTAADLKDAEIALAKLDSLNSDDLRDELGRDEYDAAEFMYLLCQDFISSWERILENE